MQVSNGYDANVVVFLQTFGKFFGCTFEAGLRNQCTGALLLRLMAILPRFYFLCYAMMYTPQPFFAFLKRLSANNHRDWFDANRAEYDQLRKDLLNATAQIISSVQQFDPSVGPITPSECLFRINRDVRFSHNKSPYKTHFGVFVARGGRKSAYSGYYLHLEPGASFLGGGLYMPQPAVLKRIRQEIFYNYRQFLDIVKDPEFEAIFGTLSDMGDRLVRPPKGYDSSFEGIDYLMNKHFVVGHSPDEKSFATDNLVEKAVGVFKVMKNFNAFLNAAVEDS